MWLSLSLCIYCQVRRWARSVPFILWPGDSGHWRRCGPATEATEFSATYSHVFELVKNFEGELRDRVSEIYCVRSIPASFSTTCLLMSFIFASCWLFSSLIYPLASSITPYRMLIGFLGEPHTPMGERNSYHQVTPADHILLNY